MTEPGLGVWYRSGRENSLAILARPLKSYTMQHRVLYIARAPFVSGAERALESMLRHLNRDQVQAGVILGHDTALSESIQP